MTANVRTQRSVVDQVAQRGYDHIQRLEKLARERAQKPKRSCSLEGCSVVLSMYNDTDFCAQHQRGNILIPKFL
jgi:hypothetical protein